MLARSRRITLRNGLDVCTPLLIPSLSSGAVVPMPFKDQPDTEPEPTPCSKVHSQWLVGGIEESLLISAYDIGHQLLVDSAAFTSGFKESRYAQPRVLVIDSGWYEKNGGPPAGQFAGGLKGPLPWEEPDYRLIIDNLDGDLRPIVVGWDYIGPYEEQIGLAQDFFGGRISLASTLLLKPPPGSRFHHFDKLSDEDAGHLRAFDVIGVTEREIGDSVLDRLVAISRLRRQLDEVQVLAPVHVFGGLDPLHTPLYFAAGAELFDGLGWLRYAYREGVAMNREAATLLDRQIRKRSMQALHSVSLQNLDELSRLADDLRLFVHGSGDWSALHRGSSLKPIFESLQERMEVSGGR